MVTLCMLLDQMRGLGMQQAEVCGIYTGQDVNGTLDLGPLYAIRIQRQPNLCFL